MTSVPPAPGVDAWPTKMATRTDFSFERDGLKANKGKAAHVLPHSTGTAVTRPRGRLARVRAASRDVHTDPISPTPTPTPRVPSAEGSEQWLPQ